MGQPVSIAIMKPPFLKGSSSPVRLRVPSGAIHTLVPLASFSLATARLSTARWRSARSIAMKPASCIALPNTGSLKSSILATMRRLAPSTWKSTGMS